jgi:L-ascorbate metabolism protein UlaG (beta-lactamase superfamily)
MFEYENIKIVWTGHAGFRINDGITIYIDPYELAVYQPADLILITHDHFDHLSMTDLRKVVSERTTIIAPYEAEKSLSDLLGERVFVKPGDVLEARGVKIWAVPAYNINKFRSSGIVYHPREDLKVGYVLQVSDVKIYHAGDTDNIPEMKGVECDIALLPISGKYVMTVEEAVAATKTIRPKVVIPMHYGAIIGSEADAEKFRSLLSNVPIDVVVLDKE